MRLKFLSNLIVVPCLAACSGDGLSGMDGLGGNDTDSHSIGSSQATLSTSGNAFTLDVSRTGSGNISAGTTLGCTASGCSPCTASYASGTSVTLTATPVAGYTFSGWGGDCAAGGASLKATVTMNANKTCSARFTRNTPPPAQFRGVNITGMEMGYEWYDRTTGPVAGTSYPILNTRLIDYFLSKGISAVRLLFQWEAMQPNLYDPIPNVANAPNYLTYFSNLIRVVNYATNAGMQVVIEPWQANSSNGVGGGRWRGCEIGSTATCPTSNLKPVPVPMDAFADFWSKMAALFKGYPRVAYGLVNEPNSQSTTTWFKAAQAAITAIRNTGSTQRIFVPGNGWTSASDWTSTGYDTDKPQVSNANGWLNANGSGKPLFDPLNNIAIEAHTYVDSDQSGGHTDITSVTAACDHVKVTLDWAAAHGLKVYLGEIGFYANASTKGFTPANAWADFVGYFNSNPDTFLGYTWWAAGDPTWWKDVAANGGGHFSVSPTNSTTYTGDTVNMQMIQNDFQDF
ncbi:MAG: cellulase family glycosylhydrolase [Polyangiaceae bacterium]|nr:cellulase family glycosylhydrolase [Polyangiaceae bacterium]